MSDATENGHARPVNARDEEPRGLECPRCGCRHLPVIYTRRLAKRTMRRRECRHCGRRMTSYEKLS